MRFYRVVSVTRTHVVQIYVTTDPMYMKQVDSFVSNQQNFMSLQLLLVIFAAEKSQNRTG